MYKDARIEGDYRYWLSRIWGDVANVPVVGWIGLNPSTADASQDDPTIRKMMGFTKKWGYQGMYVFNIYAYRSTDPKELKHITAPVGVSNDDILIHMSTTVLMPIVVACWGANAEPGRAGRVLDILKDYCAVPVSCLGKTKAGYPRHPLYVPYSKELELL